MRKLKEKIMIGRTDKGDFPDLGFKNVAMKIDTGAYTSAIHCQKIEVKDINGQEVLFFTLLDPSHKQYSDTELSTENFKEKRIKSSFGTTEKRFIVQTNIRLFGKNHRIELSLSERGEMRYPILIGRKFLMGKFIVDSSKYNLSYKMKLVTKNKLK